MELDPPFAKLGGTLNPSQACILVFLGTIGIGAAPAQQASNKASAVTTPPTTTAPTAAATPVAHSTAVLKQAKLAGYHIKKLREGAIVFCRDQTHLGSRFSTETCIDEAQLEESLIRAQTQRDNLANRRGEGTAIR